MESLYRQQPLTIQLLLLLLMYAAAAGLFVLMAHAYVYAFMAIQNIWSYCRKHRRTYYGTNDPDYYGNNLDNYFCRRRFEKDQKEKQKKDSRASEH